MTAVSMTVLSLTVQCARAGLCNFPILRIEKVLGTEESVWLEEWQSC